MSIPKIIHYCWFGGKNKTELAEKCITSWKKHCPDYDFIEWNESNFDINYNSYVKEAYESKKWAFVTDVVRLFALVNYGGIYMDTDVEVLKPLDELLEYEAVSGFENKTHIPTGLMACEKGHPLFNEFLDEYQFLHFIKSDGSFDLTTNVTRITNTCKKYGFQPNNILQTINGFTLLPTDYLCPKSYDTGVINITKNTLVIHHFGGSWQDPQTKIEFEKRRKLSRYIGIKNADVFLGIKNCIKKEGLVMYCINRIFRRNSKNKK